MKPTAEHLNTEFLPVVLCLLPVLAINLAISFIYGINYNRQKEEYQTNAFAQAEALYAASDFDRQVSTHAGRFIKNINSLLELYTSKAISEKAFKANAEAFYRSEFLSPFPAAKAFVFELSGNLSSCRLLYKNSKDAIGDSAYRMAFSFLVKKAENVKNPQKRSSILRRLFGDQLDDGELLISDESRSRISYVSHLSSAHCLLWNYKKYKNNKLYGFFVLVKADRTCQSTGRLMALNDLKKSGGKNTYGAFIPLFQNVGGAVIQDRLYKSKLFQSWLKKEKSFFAAEKQTQSINNPNDENEIKSVEKILSEGKPKPQKVGNYEAYSYIGKGASHKAVLFKKAFGPKLMPHWLKAFNIAFGFIFVLLLTRGVLFGEWLKMRLKMRFLTVYLLSASLPVVMLIAALGGYLLQYKKAKEFALVNDLKLVISRFDTKKDMMQSEYKAAFSEALADERVIKALKNKNYSLAKNTIVGSFNTKGLPLLGLKIIDINNSRNKNGKDNPDAVYYGGTLRAKSEPTINALSRPIAKMLKLKYENKLISASNLEEALNQVDFAKPNDTEQVSEQAYKSMSEHSMAYDLEVGRMSIILHKTLTNSISHIHDRILIDGRPQYALLAVWDNQSLDETLYKSTLNALKRERPEVDIAAFKQELVGLSSFPKLFDRHSADLLKLSKTTAEQAFFRNGFASSKPRADYTAVAMASPKYLNTVFAAGSDHRAINADILKRILLVALIIIASLLLVIACTSYSAAQIIKPIILLKSGIDKVACGILSTQILSSRQDEIGSLCKEFSSMTEGLRERKRLSTLISDHAVSAITTSETANELKEKSFQGVALVSDIRNFTVMCEKQSPKEVTRLLNRHYAEMSDIIGLYGGKIYKFIGDAIEAVFEDSSEYNEPAGQRAFNAACLMLLRVKQINKERSEKSLFNYKCGVGLAAGALHSGLVGSLKSRVDYALLGRPLEEAAELEGISKLYKGLPLITDKNVCEIVKKADIKLERFKTPDNRECFVLENKDCLRIAKAGFDKKQAEAKNRAKQQELAQAKTIQISKVSFKSALFNFAVSVAFILFIVLGIALSRQFSLTAAHEREKSARSEENHALAKQLLADCAPMYAFETKCQKLVKDFEDKISKNDEFLKTGSTNFLDLRVGSLKNGLNTAAGVFFYCRAKNGLHVLKGISNATLNDFLEGRKTSIRADIANVFDSTDSNGLEQKYYVFYTEIAKIKYEGELSAFSKPKNSPAGFLLLCAPCKEIDSNIQYQIKAFESKDLKLAASTKDGKIISSEGFSKTALSALKRGAKTASDAEINGRLLTIDAREGLNPLIIASEQQLKTSANAFDKKSIKCYAGIILVFALFSLLINFWHTPIDFYISAKIYLAAIGVAVVPVVFTSLLFARFIAEDYAAQSSGEKHNLSEFLTNFENKKNVSDPLMWNVVARYLKSGGIKALASASLQAEKELKGGDLSKTPKLSPLNKAYLDSTICKWLYNANANLRNDIYTFRIKQAVAVDKNFEYSASIQQDNQDFLEVVKQFTKSLAAIKYPESFLRMHQDGNVSLKDVAVGDAAFDLIKAMYGAEMFLRIVSAAEIPLNVFSARGAFTYRLAFLSENQNPFLIDNTKTTAPPKWALYFFAHHDYNSFLSMLAQKFSTEAKPIYVGNFRQNMFPPGLKHGLAFKNLAALAAYSYSPASAQITEKQETFTLCTDFCGSESETIIAGAVSDKPIRQRQARLIKYFIAALVFMLVVLLTASKAIASDISTPLSCLLTGFKHVSKGELNYRINLNRHDELGELCSAFDLMVRGLAEKETMSKMLSASAKSFAAGQKDEIAVKEYVFLYAGIPAFNAFTEYSAIEETFSDLQKHITGVSNIIIGRHGDIDKIIEHRILAVFNTNNGLPEAINAACNTAAEIIRGELKGTLPYPVSIGINCGKVIAGFLGVGTKRDFTVIGDAVNVAARIEGFAQKMRYRRCLISENVFEMLPNKAIARFYDRVRLKGKSAPMRLYRLDID